MTLGLPADARIELDQAELTRLADLAGERLKDALKKKNNVTKEMRDLAKGLNKVAKEHDKYLKDK